MWIETVQHFGEATLQQQRTTKRHNHPIRFNAATLGRPQCAFGRGGVTEQQIDIAEKEACLHVRRIALQSILQLDNSGLELARLYVFRCLVVVGTGLHFGIGESPPLAIARSVSLERAVVA